MARVLLQFLLAIGSANLLAAAMSDAAEAFEGVWVGRISAPDKQAEFGLAFTRTSDGLLVSVHLPAMFLHSANFGRADIRGGVFTFAPLDLSVTVEGDRLSGFFAPGRWPVELNRGGTFSSPPAAPVYPPAPRPAWVQSLGAGAWATPAVLGEHLYVATIDGKIHALRVADGTGAWTWSGAHPLYGAPLATEDALYFVDAADELVALSRLDGVLRWRLPLHERPNGTVPPADPTFNHRTSSPVMDAKGVLYVGSTSGGLYAIRAKTGRVLWRHDTRAPVHSAVTIAGEELIVACFDGTVFAVNRRTRQESMRTKLGGAVVSAPVISGDRIIVGARDYVLYGLTRTGAVAWRNSFWFSWVESTPRVAGGLVLVGGSDYRRVTALEPGSGREVWATDVRGLSWGSPVVTDRTVFAGTAGQNIAGTVIKHTGGIVALDRQNGAVRWRYESPDAPPGGFSGFAGSLVLANGLVMGATVDGTLTAFPVGE